MNEFPDRMVDWSWSGRRLKCESDMIRKLVYTLNPRDDSVVFATPDRAQLVDRINRAIAGSTTWVEFRKSMPRAEYSSIVQAYDVAGEPRPKGSDAFSASQLPGFDEGDYPPWLQAEMDQVLPRSFFDRYAVRSHGMTSGSLWTIPKANLADALEALRLRGYQVDEAAHETSNQSFLS